MFFSATIAFELNTSNVNKSLNNVQGRGWAKSIRFPDTIARWQGPPVPVSTPADN